jgi:hypothetical protein
MKYILPSLAFFALSIFFFSCSSMQTSTPSAIGILPLGQYNYSTVSSPADTLYKVIRTAEEFRASFAQTTAEARQPDFSGQMVIAIIVNEAAGNPLQFEKAETVGTTVNVYARSCEGPDCNRGQAVLATIPRVGNARNVRFFVNGESRGQVYL